MKNEKETEVARFQPVNRLGKPAWKRAGLRLVVKGVSLSRAVIEERRA